MKSQISSISSSFVFYGKNFEEESIDSKIHSSIIFLHKYHFFFSSLFQIIFNHPSIPLKRAYEELDFFDFFFFCFFYGKNFEKESIDSEMIKKVNVNREGFFQLPYLSIEKQFRNPKFSIPFLSCLLFLEKYTPRKIARLRKSNDVYIYIRRCSYEAERFSLECIFRGTTGRTGKGWKISDF